MEYAQSRQDIEALGIRGTCCEKIDLITQNLTTLLKMVWNIGQDVDSIDDDEQADWKDWKNVLENPDKVRDCP